MINNKILYILELKTKANLDVKSKTFYKLIIRDSFKLLPASLKNLESFFINDNQMGKLL